MFKWNKKKEEENPSGSRIVDSPTVTPKSSATWASSFGGKNTMMSSINSSPMNSLPRNTSSRPRNSLIPKNQPPPPQIDEDDDLLDDLDLNPAVDELAWNAPWYRESINDKDVQRALTGKPEGAFMIRDRLSPKNSFDIFVVVKNKITSHVITSGKDGLQVAQSKLTFPVLSDLISQFSVPAGVSPFPCVLLPDALNNSKELKAIESEELALSKVNEWSHQDIISWLTKKNLKDCIPTFEARQISGATLMTLSQKDVRTLGLPPSAAAELLHALDELREDSSNAEKSLIRKRSITKQRSFKAEPGNQDQKTTQPPASTPKSLEENENVTVTKKGIIIPKPLANNLERSPSPLSTPKRAGNSTNNNNIRDDVTVESDYAHDYGSGARYEPNPHAAVSPSCLRKLNAMRSPNKVSFDERSILATQGVGITAFLDEEASKSLYFLGKMPVEDAERQLDGAPDGAFVLVHDSDSPYCLVLSYLYQGAPVHKFVVLEDGELAIKGSESAFACVSELILRYAHPSDDLPIPLLIPVKKIRKPSARRPGNKMNASGEELPTWFCGRQKEEDASGKIEFEPNGSFVVVENDSGYTLLYVSAGVVHKKYIVKETSGLRFRGASQSFSDLIQLALFYSDNVTDNMECALRWPAGTKPASQPQNDGPTMARKPSMKRQALKRTNTRGTLVGQQPASELEVESAFPHLIQCPEPPGWYVPNVSKAEALEGIQDKPDGAFVIRSFDARKDCYALTYRFKGQLIHEAIIHEGPYCVYLESAPNRKFKTLNEFVTYYSEMRPELRYPLMPSYAARKGSGTTTNMARQASFRRASALTTAPAPVGKPKPMLKRQNTGLNRSAAPVEDEEDETEASSNDTKVSSNAENHEPHQARPTLVRQPSKGAMGNNMLVRQPSTKMVMQGLQRQSSRGMGLGLSVAGNIQPGVSARLDARAQAAGYCFVTKDDSEALGNLPKSKNGNFVVRKCDKHFGILSVNVQGKISEYIIEEDEHGIHLQGSKIRQPNLSALVAYYKLPEQKDICHSLVT